MLVTFRTNAYANITMFGDVAKQLLELLRAAAANKADVMWDRGSMR